MVLRSRTSLRERLDWIVKAARSGHYGDILYAGDRRLEHDYLLVTGGTVHTSGGRTRARYLTSDLVELCDRGVMRRERSSKGFAYTLSVQSDESKQVPLAFQRRTSTQMSVVAMTRQSKKPIRAGADQVK